MEHAETRQSRLIVALRHTLQNVEDEKSARLEPIGLQSAHYSLMISVAESPGLSGAALARQLGVKPQNVASLVTRLAATGLLERRARSRHASGQELYLTEEGEKLLAAADSIVTGLEAEIAEVLGEEDTAHLRRILDRLMNHLPSPEEPVAEG